VISAYQRKTPDLPNQVNKLAHAATVAQRNSVVIHEQTTRQITGQPVTRLRSLQGPVSAVHGVPLFSVYTREKSGSTKHGVHYRGTRRDTRAMVTCSMACSYSSSVAYYEPYQTTWPSHFTQQQQQQQLFHSTHIN